MNALYNLVISATEKVLPVTSIFSEKMKLFLEGRKNVFQLLRDRLNPEDQTFWIHAASLGEYEQAVPIIEKIRKEFPTYKIVVTFFSPSGFEIKKNTKLVDVVTYLPLDTRSNVLQFLDLVRPEWAIFVKYEFWPNFLSELGKRQVKTVLVSGSFRNDQVFFKTYGKWMRRYLKTFTHFFVQNDESKKLLESIGFKNSTVSGDTRFDRVNQQLQQDNTLDFVSSFKGNNLCVVAGSTWPEDEELLLSYINSSADVKFIIAPHTIKPARISQLKEKITRKAILFSEKDSEDISQYEVLIIDTIGLLTKIYSYADIAYVGGAAGNTGLHNILEPATFGVPIIIGVNHQKFPEAQTLKDLGGLFTVHSAQELTSILNTLKHRYPREDAGEISRNFVQKNVGATTKILDFFQKHS